MPTALESLLRAEFWHTLTRLGEAQILLPAFGAFTVWSAARLKALREAAVAVLGLAAAILVTGLSKIAFIGYGIGWAAIDFTGISGHSMFAAAVLPLLLARCVAPPARPAAIVLGYAAAALIGISRLAVHAHSASEVLLGLALGAAASGLTLWQAQRGAQGSQVPRLLLVLLLVWMSITPAAAPPSRTHDWVTKLSLWLSGRPAPYTREQMHRDATARAQRPVR